MKPKHFSKQFLGLLLCIAIILSILPMTTLAATTSGTCGDAVTWEFDQATGTLTIRGSGAMTNYASKENVPWKEHQTSIKSVIVEDDITSIGARAFIECTNLTAITFGENSRLTTIGAWSFAWTGLKEIDLPDTLTTIETSAFHWVRSLTSVEIPAGVTTLPEQAFRGCSSLVDVKLPEGLKVIGKSAFTDCSALQSITLPSTVTNINSQAFCSCDSLTTITFEGPAPTLDSQNIFLYSDYISTIRVPRRHMTGYQTAPWNNYTLVPHGTDGGACGENATWEFNPDTGALTISGTGPMYSYRPSSSIPWSKYNNSIQSVTIEDGITTIEDYAFMECMNLQSITIPASVEKIGTLIFALSDNLTEVILLGEAPALDTDAFAVGYDNITAVVLIEKFIVKGEYLSSYLAANSTWAPYADKIVVPESLSYAAITLEKDNWAWTGQQIAPEITVKDALGNTLTEGSDYSVSYGANTAIGNGSITITGKGDYTGELEKTFSIVPAAAAYTAPAANTLFYDGTPKELITAGHTEHGTMLYGTSEAGPFSTAIPTGTIAKDYTVWYYVQGDANHADSEKLPLNVTIHKVNVSITIEDQTITYGEEISQTAYSFVSELDGSSISVVLIPSTANVTKNGTITASVTVLDSAGNDVTENVNLTINTGKLIVQADLSGIADLTENNVSFADKAVIEATLKMLRNADRTNIEEETQKYWDDIIVHAETLLDTLIEKAVSAENAKKVEELINKLPDIIKKDDKTAIKAADDAYTALSDYEKSLVDKDAKKTLEDAKAALEKLNMPDVPQTGDNSNLLLWVVLLFVSGIGIFGITLYDHKRKATQYTKYRI